MPAARILRVVCLALVLWPGAPHAGGMVWWRAAWAGEAPRSPRENARITALLDAVVDSNVEFVREGSAYSGVEGRKHLERKLRYAGDRIQTAEEFIEGLASRSSITGRPYLVRLPGGAEMESGMWLRQRLAEIDALQ